MQNLNNIKEQNLNPNNEKNIKQNLLLVGFKPPFISSNAYLSQIKRKFGIKKFGYSGTLDPFASGVLVLASGAYTKLLGHLSLSPKTYQATLWLGAESETLDIEGISNVKIIGEFSQSRIKSALDSMLGTISYTPPKFSAKKINGIRAYKLARDGQDVSLAECEMEIFSIKLLGYNHPFLSFEVSVSKGAYVRSIGQMIAQKLGTSGALSALKRISEGDFRFENYKILDPLEVLPYPQIDLKHLSQDAKNGRKIKLNVKNGKYIAIFDEFFSIISVKDSQVEYILNRIE